VLSSTRHSPTHACRQVPGLPSPRHGLTALRSSGRAAERCCSAAWPHTAEPRPELPGAAKGAPLLTRPVLAVGRKGPEPGYGEQNTTGAPHWPPPPPCQAHIRALELPPCLTWNRDGGIDGKDFMVEEQQPLMVSVSAERGATAPGTTASPPPLAPKPRGQHQVPHCEHKPKAKSQLPTSALCFQMLHAGVRGKGYQEMIKQQKMHRGKRRHLHATEASRRTCLVHSGQANFKKQPSCSTSSHEHTLQGGTRTHHHQAQTSQTPLHQGPQHGSETDVTLSLASPI